MTTVSFGLRRKRQTRSSACEQKSVTTIWSKSAMHGALGEAHGEQTPQGRIAERLVILAPALRILARGQAQRPLDAKIEHPGIGQPACARTEKIGRADHRVPVDPGRVDRGLRRRVGG